MTKASLKSQPRCPEINRWQRTSSPPLLREGELHLWKLDFPGSPELTANVPLLSDEERERARSIRNPAVRSTFVWARTAKRRILGGYLGSAPEHIRFDYGPHGKPSVNSHEETLKFNLTHSGDLSLLAVTRGVEVGLDTERVKARRGMEAIAARMFDAGRVRHLASLPEQQRLRMFYVYWTWTEAVVKARGGGLFDGCSRELAATSHACFIPHPGFQACVVVDGPCPPLDQWLTLLFDSGADTQELRKK